MSRRLPQTRVARVRPWLRRAALAASFAALACSALAVALGQAEPEAERKTAEPPAAAPAPPSAVASERKPWPPTQTFRKAAILRFEGEIDSLLQGFLTRKLAEAKKAGADLVVLDIESPGGHLHESGEIAEQLNELEGVHTVAFIRREALSGAAYVSLGCDNIVLHPSARLGDVGVIFLADDFAFRYAPEKIRSALVQEMRILAENHHRPPALAEAMVDMDVEVFRFENSTTNVSRFLSEKEAAALPDAADWTKRELVLESQKGRFLTVSGERAVELTLAEGTAVNLDELKTRYDVSGGWIELQSTSTDKAIYLLHLWWVTGLLFLIGLVGMLSEFLKPGTCLGGLVALLCFSLFFWSRFLSGSSGWLEVMLFVVGLVFLGFEFFILPGFGVAGVAGFSLVVVALVLACQNFVIPQTSAELTTTSLALVTVAGAMSIFTVIAAIVFTYAKQLPFLNKLMLHKPPPMASADSAPDAKDDQKSPALPPLLPGDFGRAETTLRPSGRALFGQRVVEVVSTGELISAGAAIRVVQVDDTRIVVEEAA